MTTAALETASPVALLSLSDALDMGQDVWDDLLARSGSSNPFMTWAWHRAWADAVSPVERDACQVIVLTSATGQVEALFPLRLEQARFHRVPVPAADWSVGDLGCPDHLELLASPEADFDALVETLAVLPWQVMTLGNVAEGAANIERFRAACERRGWTVRTRVLWRCPYLDLPGSWEELMSSLSRQSRETVRRYERKLRQNHDVTLTDYGSERWEEGWRHLRRLHAARWNGAGALHEASLEQLHRQFGAWLGKGEQDRLWLVTLDLDGTPAAAWYGFSFGETHYSYQMGRDPGRDAQSLGSVMMGLMIRRAIERGHKRFDFLRGEESYKRRWTRMTRSGYEFVVIRPGWRGALLRGLDWVARKRAPVWVPH